jgi:transcriptional regulator with XRE-family HTH domain
MHSPEVLQAVPTASGSATSGYNVAYGTERYQYRHSTSATHSDEPRSAASVVSPATIVINRLLREEAHAAFSGILYDLLTTGVGHGTQYLWRVESEDLPRLSKALSRSSNAEEMTRRALDLSGLTREQLATAMGVKRQSVQNWLGARGMSPDNQERLKELITLFERARRRFGNAKQVSQWFTTPVREDGPSPLEMLTTSSIDAVKGRLLRRAPMRGTALSPSASSQGGVPRRTGPVGYRPPWTQPSRSPEFDPEEGESTVIDGTEEPYRDAHPSRVTGLARA